jgi:hypothetical protein
MKLTQINRLYWVHDVFPVKNFTKESKLLL